MADVIYNRGKFRLLSGALDWDGAAAGTIRVLLLMARSTAGGADEDPDLNFVSELLALAGLAELATDNYARQDVATRTTTEDDTNNRVSLDAADNVWPNLGPAVGGPQVLAAVIFERVGADDSTPADDPLICLIDLPDRQLNGSQFTAQWNAAGIITGT